MVEFVRDVIIAVTILVALVAIAVHPVPEAEASPEGAALPSIPASLARAVQALVRPDAPPAK